MPKPDFASEERLLQQLDRESRDRTERVKEMLRDEGRLDLIDELDRKLRDIDSGVQGARSTWHSISDPQRRILLILAGGNRRLVREPASRHFYKAVGAPGALSRVATLPGVRNLARRGLLDWDGGAFDPEAAAVLTEQARFVLKHGRPEPGTHFEGSRP